MNDPEVMLPQFSLGCGDRFAMEAEAQLRACMHAAKQGVTVIPVWNKSNREHLIIGSEPEQTRHAADAAVRVLGWDKPYFVDADHILRGTVDRFLPFCDFFTIDVAEKIGVPAETAVVDSFVRQHRELAGRITLPHVAEPVVISEAEVRAGARKFLKAVSEAGETYRYLRERRGADDFVAEVSMDETDAAQSPAELLVILAAIADEGIPIQTIAPKFSGRFNKGVDYVGDVAQFEREFRQDVGVLALATERYGLPRGLKLSVHSGSDKFSIYAAIHRILRETGAGVHLKTAGTTWLEELIGLAEAGGDGLQLVREIYGGAYERLDELTAPYATVIDISRERLPSPEQVSEYGSEEMVAALRHDPSNPGYNADLRQLLHVAFKIAAGMGERYTRALSSHREVVQANVTKNLFERHIRPVFLGV